MRARAVVCLPVLFSVLFAVVYGGTNGPLHWTNATVPLDIDPELDPIGLRHLHFAVDYYETLTCVRFLFNDTTNHQPRLFVNSKGCCSVTYPGSDQQLNIGIGMSVKGMFHETLHALGMSHTQQLPNAHLYLKDNEKNEYAYDDVNLHGIPFEIATSLISPYPYAWNSKYNKSMHSEFPSFYEILEVNIIYDCFKKCEDTPKPACQNGGVVDVNNCSRCTCPRGYAGDFCEERSPGNAQKDCGKTIKVTETVQSVELAVQGKSNDEEIDNTRCYYLFEAPPCKHVQVIVRDSTDDCRQNCGYIGLEVYANIDKRQSGYRYCCHKHVNETAISDGNTLIIDAYNWDVKEGYNFKIDVVAVD